MARVLDVAAFILSKAGPMTAMKLQKLVYYSQAWSLVWDEKPLFEARIEAWANGPVCPELYYVHRGQFMLSTIPGGDPEGLTGPEKSNVLRVVAAYRKYSSQALSDLAHREDPWRKARAEIPPSERSSAEITHAAMAEYYESLSGLDDATTL